VFDDFNTDQIAQVFAGTNEAFDEVWWFYCSAASTIPDKYVVYNYVDRVWYYGSMTRTAWTDAPLARGPLAATAISNLVVHETGVDDLSTAATLPVEAFVRSADFDIGDGHNYAFVRKMLPDVSFTGSSAAAPQVYITVQGRINPGGAVVSGPANPVSRTATTPVTLWTDEISLRIRARQMNVEMRSTATGVAWQCGTPRIEVRPSGRSA
jgi:hypothetical protein